MPAPPDAGHPGANARCRRTGAGLNPPDRSTDCPLRSPAAYDTLGAMSTSAGLPRVAVIGTGGTIGSDGRHSLDFVDYPDVGRKLEIDELLGRFPELTAAAVLTPVRFRAVGSTAIG